MTGKTQYKQVKNKTHTEGATDGIEGCSMLLGREGPEAVFVLALSWSPEETMRAWV